MFRLNQTNVLKSDMQRFVFSIHQRHHSELHWLSNNAQINIPIDGTKQGVCELNL